MEIERIKTGLAQLHNCTKHTLIRSLPESFESQRACSIECCIYTCRPSTATDYDTIFTAMINS